MLEHSSTGNINPKTRNVWSSRSGRYLLIEWHFQEISVDIFYSTTRHIVMRWDREVNLCLMKYTRRWNNLYLSWSDSLSLTVVHYFKLMGFVFIDWFFVKARCDILRNCFSSPHRWLWHLFERLCVTRYLFRLISHRGLRYMFCGIKNCLKLGLSDGCGYKQRRSGVIYAQIQPVWFQSVALECVINPIC